METEDTGWNYTDDPPDTCTTTADLQNPCYVQILVTDGNTGEPVSGVTLRVYDADSGSLIERWMLDGTAEIFRLDFNKWYRIEIENAPSGNYQSNRLFTPSRLESAGTDTYRYTLQLR